MVFHWSLSDSTSPQVFRTFLSILAALNNSVVWMVFADLPTSMSSCPFNFPWVTVAKALIKIGIIVTFMFHIFPFPSKVKLLIILLTFFQFYSVVSRGSKVQNFVSSVVLSIIISCGLLAEIMWSVSMSKSYRTLCVSFSRRYAGLCIYHLIVPWHLDFLHISQCITLLIKSCSCSDTIGSYGVILCCY